MSKRLLEKERDNEIIFQSNHINFYLKYICKESDKCHICI